MWRKANAGKCTWSRRLNPQLEVVLPQKREFLDKWIDINDAVIAVADDDDGGDAVCEDIRTIVASEHRQFKIPVYYARLKGLTTGDVIDAFDNFLTLPIARVNAQKAKSVLLYRFALKISSAILRAGLKLKKSSSTSLSALLAAHIVRERITVVLRKESFIQ